VAQQGLAALHFCAFLLQTGGHRFGGGQALV
jgi:hypothetical protein